MEESTHGPKELTFCTYSCSSWKCRRQRTSFQMWGKLRCNAMQREQPQKAVPAGAGWLSVSFPDFVIFHCRGVCESFLGYGKGCPCEWGRMVFLSLKASTRSRWLCPSPSVSSPLPHQGWSYIFLSKEGSGLELRMLLVSLPSPRICWDIVTSVSPELF